MSTTTTTTADVRTFPATPAAFREVFGAARDAHPHGDATSAPEDIPDDARYFLTADQRSGYGITPDGTLIALWSLERGRGDALVRDAIARGAIRLDCFDGYLPTLYARHGFRETHREPNWTPGGPDVVYMARPAA